MQINSAKLWCVLPLCSGLNTTVLLNEANRLPSRVTERVSERRTDIISLPVRYP